MPSAVQAHSKAIFRDSTLGALIESPTPAYLVEAGGGVATIGDARPEAYIFAGTGGTYTLMAVADYDPDTMDRLDAVRLGALVRFY